MRSNPCRYARAELKTKLLIRVGQQSRRGRHAKATEFPKDVQVTRGWIVVKVAMTGRKSGLFQKSPRVVEWDAPHCRSSVGSTPVCSRCLSQGVAAEHLRSLAS